MVRWWGHFKTVNHHKKLVCQYCFRIGLYRQGILHDLSKYSPVEFLAGIKYFQGDRSPNDAQRKALGYSAAWLHHKGRNKHHLEYWIDYAPDGDHNMSGMEMPFHYVAEMICDRIAASKTYRKENYQDCDPYLYYENSKEHYILHPQTRMWLEKLLFMLKEEGEDSLFSYLRKELNRQKQNSTRQK